MNTTQKPACIQSEAIAAVAQQGVERALADVSIWSNCLQKKWATSAGGFIFLP